MSDVINDTIGNTSSPKSYSGPTSFVRAATGNNKIPGARTDGAVQRSWDRARAAGRTFYVFAAAVVAILLLYASISGLQGAMRDFPWDFVVNYRIGQAFLDGYNPYTPEGRVRAALTMGPSAIGFPPSTVLWFLPLVARVDLATAHAVLNWLSVAFVLVEMWMLTSTLKVPCPAATAWLAFAYVLSLPLFLNHLKVGQISAPIALLCFLGWFNARRGDDVAAGVALGIACTLKLFPGLLVFLFLLWRRFRLVGVALGLYLAAVVITCVRFGVSSWTIFFKNERAIADVFLGHVQNQSLFGVVQRYFHPTCRPPAPVDPRAVWLTTALGLACIAVASWRALRARSQEDRDLAFATFSVLALVFSQWTWEHYDVIAILPVAIAATALVKLWRSAPQWRPRLGAAAGLVLVSAVVASWRIDMEKKITYMKAVRGGQKSLHRALHAYETVNWLPTVALLVIVGALLWHATSARRQSQASKVSNS
jgi:hypothetical protein